MDSETVQENEIQVTDNPVIENKETDLRAARKDFSMVGLAFFMMTAITVVLQTVQKIFLDWAFPRGLQSSLLLYLVIMLPVYLVAVPVCIYILRRIEPRSIGRKSISCGAFLGILLMSLPILYGGSLLGLKITEQIVNFTGITSMDPRNRILLNADVLSDFLFIGLIGPIIEEYLFRKVLIDRIIKYGQGIAIFTSALVFGLAHGNFTQLFLAFGLGLMFGYVYCRTGKLRYSIALHIIFNTLTIVLMPLIISNYDLKAFQALLKMDADNSKLVGMIRDILPGVLAAMVFSLAMVIMVISGIVLLVDSRKRFLLEKAELPIPKGKRFKTVWLNIGMFLFFTGCVGMFVYYIAN